ncbi:DUF488 domain-containing protein [Actinomadura madurae]|uniref:DUF488 domain-containing protein n=1 Tax=Actinomadura madurae TaxID=1993 RepID=UPI0020D20993|nr:DUF488 family protein [Actinomadura madurae]
MNTEQRAAPAAGLPRWAGKPVRRLTAGELAEALAYLERHRPEDDVLGRALARRVRPPHGRRRVRPPRRGRPLTGPGAVRGLGEGIRPGMEVRLRRVYEPPSSDDGTRILVDRVWPRGLSKEDARLDEWLKDVAPSTELRKWYGHDAEKFAEFARRYDAELAEPERASALDHLRELAGQGTVTLLTATKDAERSQAAVLAAASATPADAATPADGATPVDAVPSTRTGRAA